MYSLYFPPSTSSYSNAYDSLTGIGYPAASSSDLGGLLNTVNSITTQPIQPLGQGDDYIGTIRQNIQSWTQPLLDFSDLIPPGLGSYSNPAGSQASILVSSILRNGGSHAMNALAGGMAIQDGIYNSVGSRGQYLGGDFLR